MERLKFKKLDYSVKKEDGTEEIKKSEGKLPTRATAGDAGLDLYATRITQEVDNSGKLVLVYHTDLAVEIPEGYCGLLMMKSSISKRSIALTNGVGLIDTGYRGEQMLFLQYILQMNHLLNQLLYLVLYQNPLQQKS